MLRSEATMRATIALLVILGTCACGKADVPTAPTPSSPLATTPATPATPEPPPPTPPEPREAGIASFSMTGQLIQGVYHYWPAVTISAGSEAIVLKGLIFSLRGVDIANDRVGMNRTIAAGTSYEFDAHNFEVLGSSLGTEATVTVTYMSVDGHAYHPIATTTIAPIESAPASASLQISDFALTRWQEPYEWDYWPRFTVTETSGASDVTITRIEFLPLDTGINGRVPPSFGPWTVPAGGSIRLFDEWGYDEPAFGLSSSRRTDRVMVTLSYVDAAGRPGDVTAIAQVSSDGRPAAPR
jgi:hypothetical protein